MYPDTIYALSSGAPPTGVAVVRLSGPGVTVICRELIGKLPAPREARYAAIRDVDGSAIDKGLVIFFSGPSSFTGEDSLELQIHGGRAVIARLLSRLSGLENCRQAEAGEFTRRAFLNGKTDLTGVEALADLIEASTEAQRRLAIANADGAQWRLYSTWAERITTARALMEAHLDFADEADVGDQLDRDLRRELVILADAIAAHVKGFRAAEIIREGFVVAIVGRPNAGKSSLLNYLARRDVAIVSDIAGTTRDIVEIELELDGLKIILKDTAGLRASDDPIEKIGIARATRAMETADMVLFLRDDAHEPAPPGAVIVETKSDIRPQLGSSGLAVSVRTGAGISDLLDTISRHAGSAAHIGSDAVPSRRRHVDALEGAAGHLHKAVTLLANDVVLSAEELRLSASALGTITGQTDVEDVLEMIFSRFCIGK